MVARRPELVPVVSCAPSADRRAIEHAIRRERLEARIAESTPHVLRAASVGIAKSGTITMDAALAGLPIVVTYAASRVSLIQYHLLVKRMIRYIAMPNILMDEEIIPERYGKRGRPECLAGEALAIYDDPARRSAILAGYDRMRAELGEPGAASAVADMVEEMLAEAARTRRVAGP
jgi:lipid-A-disaccharide synthase